MASGKEITIYNFAQYPRMTDAIISRVLNQQSAIYVDDCRMARPNSQSKNSHRVWGISEFETFGIGK